MVGAVVTACGWVVLVDGVPVSPAGEHAASARTAGNIALHTRMESKTKAGIKLADNTQKEVTCPKQ